MPLFHLSDEEVADLVAYFMALVDEPYPYETIEPTTNPEANAIGRGMFRNEAQCASGACHPNPGSTPTPDNLAPSLVSTSRLKPEWVKEWIANPESFWPGNGMPYFPWDVNGTPLYSKYANGDVNAQIEGLRDYVLSLGRRMSWSAPVESAQKPASVRKTNGARRRS
jgi:mono/diheme cytochrome c family protein